MYVCAGRCGRAVVAGRSTESLGLIGMSAPPPALHSTHAIEYAIVDDNIRFEQRHTLNVGGEWLGAVPRLAICQDLHRPEFLVFHCDADWNVLGVAAGYESIAAAKAKVERSYHGLAGKWMPTGHTRVAAEEQVAESYKGWECSFCGRLPPEYEQLVGERVRICNHCVDEFHKAIHNKADET